MPTRIIFGPQPPEPGHGPARVRGAGEVHDEIDVAESPEEVLAALTRSSSGFAQLTDEKDQTSRWISAAHVQRFEERRS